MRDEVLSDAITVIPLVHNGMAQRLPRRPLRKHGLKDGPCMTLPGRQDDRNAGAFIATAGMDGGRQATPRAAQSLGGVPAVFFHAPAAC
jgi:hypothetical protein